MSASNSAVLSRSQSLVVSSAASGPIVLLGRFLFVLIFVMSGPRHFMSQTIGYAASQGVPMVSIAVPLSGVLAIAGGLFDSARLPRENRRLDDRAVSGLYHAHDAQVLDGHRSHNVPDAVSHVYEERVDARCSAARNPTGLWTLEPRLALKMIS